jgi:hypothetical protein
LDVFSLPDWIELGDWRDYEAMRKSIRKPMTDRARKLAVAKLEQLRAAGESPADVLRQSILHSWQGLFPVKPTEPTTNGKPVKREPMMPDELAAARAKVAAEIARCREIADRAKVSQ